MDTLSTARFRLWNVAAFAVSLLLVGFAAGCFDKASGSQINQPVLTQDVVASLVAQSLGSAGIPEPPLSESAGRAERAEYLAACEGALVELRKLPSSRPASVRASARLLPEDNTHEILLISKMLAVELADAIDRSQPERAAGAVQLAFDYADSVSRRSVPDWTASGAVADTLALGIRSVHEQLDEKTAEALLLKIAALEKSAPNPNISLVSDAKRIKRWLESIEANKRPVQPETVPHMTGMDPSSRAYSAPEFQKSIEALAPNGEISPDVFYAECRIAAEQAEIYLLEPRGPIPTVDGSRHPIGALVMTMLNPTVQAAADLAKLRQESLRLLALTVELSGPSPPDDIGMLGEEAISPVSELPFEYRRTNGSFDLVRPRKKAGA